MTDQTTPPPAPLPPTGDSAPLGGSAPVNAAKTPPPAAPTNSQYKGKRPALLKEMPYWWKVPQPDTEFKLITHEDIDNLVNTKGIDPEVAKTIKQDLDFLEKELMRLFRERDYLAKLHQNRYRLYQILYILLAALAGAFGGWQALSIERNPGVVPFLATAETVVALIVAFLATVGGREPAMPLYLNNRRAAEELRREFFRYITHLPPYDDDNVVRRKLSLSQRAADISRNVYPQPTKPNSNGS
ncbi:MAG: DUF4231 domain-containing protein [Anaerolinea sp.]|nr:DUF4231 domain-containing protein [Anaerolinea sp.]